jgi:hypothetical protein
MKNSLIAIMKKFDDNGRLIWFVNKIDIIVPKTKAERQESVQHARKFGSNL